MGCLHHMVYHYPNPRYNRYEASYVHRYKFFRLYLGESIVYHYLLADGTIRDVLPKHLAKELVFDNKDCALASLKNYIRVTGLNITIRENF